MLPDLFLVGGDGLRTLNIDFQVCYVPSFTGYGGLTDYNRPHRIYSHQTRCQAREGVMGNLRFPLFVHLSRQFGYLNIVMLLQALHKIDIMLGYKINRKTLSAESPRTAYGVQIRLVTACHVEINDGADLLDIDSSRRNTRRNHHAKITLTETL
jgi:hypothetical protein